MEHLLATLRAYATSTPASFGGVGLEISSSNLTFHISLVDIDTLNPHEEVVESSVESLADAMQAQGIVRDPLIVDQRERVILDGTHRYRSLDFLKCRFAPCCLVDYDNPLIKVSSWFRLFTIGEPESLAERLLRESKLNYTKQKIDVAGLTSASEYIVLTSNGMAYSYPRDLDAMERARAAITLERALTMRGHHADYLSESVALQSLKSGSVNFVIGLPVFSKQQIRKFGVRRLLLPHKTTRHVMPSRPLRMDIPLDMLRKEGLSQAEADKQLRKLLSTRRTERKPAGSVVDGRRYEEELLVFAS
jgi:hypothetical protein